MNSARSQLGKVCGRGEGGFTLTEVAVVCSIVGVIGILAFPSMRALKGSDETRASAAQIAGILKDARSRAMAEATPHMVYVNEPSVDDSGNCGPIAVVVRDADRNYAISDGDRLDEVSLSPEACDTVKLYAQDDTANPFASLQLPIEDFTARAASSSDKSGKGKSKGKGKGKGGDDDEEDDDEEDDDDKGKGKSKGKKAESPSTGLRVETVAETVLYGATFPTDELSGRPVVAFSETGVPVDPMTPTDWGSGAGGVYVTDGINAVYAAVVQPLGNVQLRKYDSGANEWH